MFQCTKTSIDQLKPQVRQCALYKSASSCEASVTNAPDFNDDCVKAYQYSRYGQKLHTENII